MPTHFTIELWTDFVRGVASLSHRVEMEKHLAQGCARCRDQVGLLRRLRSTAAGLRKTPQVPDEVLTNALQIFSPTRTVERPERRRWIAELIFDSFAEPLTAGVRSARGGTRRLLYRAEHFEVNLLADFDRRSQSVTITGQITDSAAAATVFAHVPVQLVAGRKVLLQTETGAYGEFQLNVSTVRSVNLRVAGEAAGMEIDVPLGPLWKPEADGGRRTKK